MKIQLDKDEHVLCAGDLILIKPNRLHNYETEATKKSTCLLCVFSGDLIAAISETLTKYRLESVVIHGVSKLYKDIFASMEKVDDLPTIKGFLYLLCALFYRLVDYSAEEEFTGDTALLHNMFMYIENHIDSPCNLHDLAQKLNYNESYLSRLFDRYVGISFSEYVRSIKINHACYLLKNTDESVGAISVKCGYVTQSSFNRIFKQIVGCTPKQYRLDE